MAELLASVVHEVREAFYVLDGEIFEGNQPDGPGSWGQESSPPGQDWLDVGSSSVILWGSTRDAARYVRFELWSGQPPADQSWQKSWEGELFLASGKIHIMNYSEVDFRHLLFDVGQREATWRVRIQAKLLENDREPSFPANIYQVDLYNMQLWQSSAGM
ncbi:hypothetical protein ABT352_01390 [Streptosporangium sp. NPDC000563]|uniref:hypothetical protein n=1 Tax=Streptosporangium sp. NPDC000563 TaxID=3154366 RepID=UPI00331ED4D6